MGAAELPVSRRPHTMSAAAEKRLATVPAVKASVMVDRSAGVMATVSLNPPTGL
jgi:hypothetical protein